MERIKSSSSLVKEERIQGVYMTVDSVTEATAECNSICNPCGASISAGDQCWEIASSDSSGTLASTVFRIKHDHKPADGTDPKIDVHAAFTTVGLEF